MTTAVMHNSSEQWWRGREREREMKEWHGSVGVAAAGLFPLALRAPHVLVLHAMDLATLAALGAHPAVQRRAFWRGGQSLGAEAHELLRRDHGCRCACMRLPRERPLHRGNVDG